MHRQVSDGELTVVVVPHVVALQPFVVLAAGQRETGGETGVWGCRGGGALLTMVGTVKS